MTPEPFVFRFRFQLQGGHVHVRVFAGKGEGALGKCGDLVFRENEWDAFRADVERVPRDVGSRIEFKPEEA